ALAADAAKQLDTEELTTRLWLHKLPLGPVSSECEVLRSAQDDKCAVLTLMRETGANEAAEERMRFVRFALEFRMILAGEEEWMVAQLDQLSERAIGRGAADDETFLRHLLAIFHVEFVAMAMSLEHFRMAINFLGKRPA